MKSPVQLYLRVRLPDGTYPYLKAAYASNGRIRPHQAIKDGKIGSFPSSGYYLRYRMGGKRVWEPVGDDASLGDTNLRRRNLKLQELALGDASASGSVPGQLTSPSLPLPVSSLLSLNKQSRHFCSMMQSGSICPKQRTTNRGASHSRW